MTASLRHNAARIATLAWPVFLGQLAVLGFSTIDTLLLARHSALDLASLAIGASAYTTTFVGFMGLLMAIAPIVGRLHGAGRDAEAGAQLHQALWLALGLAVFGGALLLFPEPFLGVAHPPPEIEARVRVYLRILACALPASLLFTAYRGFNVAVSRPKAVMLLQVAGFVLKVPLSALFVFVLDFGVAGCALATALVMWLQLAAAIIVMRRDAFYRPFALWPGRWPRPQRAPIMAQLKLGVPMGVSIVIEVSGFTFMAFFITRLGATPLAAHQICANVVAILYMLPLGLANATTTLVAQRIGAGDFADAKRLGWHGIAIGGSLALATGSAVSLLREPVVRLYTHDPQVIAAALPLLAFVAWFHLGDAMQCLSNFVLRAWHVATLPVAVYALALWGLGLGGGYTLAFGHLQGAPGFWAAATGALLLTAALLCGLLRWVEQQKS